MFFVKMSMDYDRSRIIYQGEFILNVKFYLSFLKLGELENLGSRGVVIRPITSDTTSPK